MRCWLAANRDERQALLTVPDPSRLTWNELRLRLRAFEMLTIWLDGEPHEVTKLRRLDERRPRRPRKAFVTSDGVAAEPTRWVHLPYLAYRCYRPLRAASRPGRDRRR